MRIAVCAALISRSVVLPSQGHASAEAICRHRYFLANNFIDVSLDSACGSQSNGLSYLPNLGSCDCRHQHSLSPDFSMGERANRTRFKHRGSLSQIGRSWRRQSCGTQKNRLSTRASGENCVLIVTTQALPPPCLNHALTEKCDVDTCTPWQSPWMSPKI